MRRVQTSRERVGEGIERDRQRERGHDGRRPRDVVGAELAASEEDLDERAREHEQERPRRAVVRMAMVARFRPRTDRKARPSSSAKAADSTGKTASENDDADEADRQDLVVEAEVERRDRADPDAGRDPREVGEDQRLDRRPRTCAGTMRRKNSGRRPSGPRRRADAERGPVRPDGPDRRGGRPRRRPRPTPSRRSRTGLRTGPSRG